LGGRHAGDGLRGQVLASAMPPPPPPISSGGGDLGVPVMMRVVGDGGGTMRVAAWGVMWSQQPSPSSLRQRRIHDHHEQIWLGGSGRYSVLQCSGRACEWRRRHSRHWRAECTEIDAMTGHGL
jgi:hypothetical protein